MKPLAGRLRAIAVAMAAYGDKDDAATIREAVDRLSPTTPTVSMPRELNDEQAVKLSIAIEDEPEPHEPVPADVPLGHAMWARIVDALAPPNALPPDGWVAVPREPTPEMIEAGKVGIFESSFHDSKADVVTSVYLAMLDAAPLVASSPAKEAEQEYRKSVDALNHLTDDEINRGIDEARRVKEVSEPSPSEPRDIVSELKIDALIREWMTGPNPTNAESLINVLRLRLARWGTGAEVAKSRAEARASMDSLLAEPPLAVVGAEPSPPDTDRVPKIIAAWFKYDWDSLREDSIVDRGFPVFSKLPNFQGGKEDLRRFAASLAEPSPSGDDAWAQSWATALGIVERWRLSVQPLAIANVDQLVLAIQTALYTHPAPSVVEALKEAREVLTQIDAEWDGEPVDMIGVREAVKNLNAALALQAKGEG